MTEVVLILAGLATLAMGGDWLVRGAVAVARRLGVSPMLIGLTLVGFGTSAPELVTSLQAASLGAPGIAVGNVVGSNIANILLILGLAALIAPVSVVPGAFRRDATVLGLATAAALGVVLTGALGRGPGALLLAGLAGFLTLAVLSERRRPGPAGAVYAAEAGIPRAPPAAFPAALTLFAGIAAVILGARALVAGAVGLAQGFGVPEAVIGLTVVAIGTSLPELVTSVVAARKGESDVAFGNILGSNIFNILGILGATALVRPLAVPPEIAARDIWVMCAATLLMFAVAVTGWRVTRGEGAVLLALYLAYTGWLVVTVAPG